MGLRDYNPATPSKICPKCGEKSLRIGFTTFFIRHYGVYCENCGYQTKPTVSGYDGFREWREANNE